MKKILFFIFLFFILIISCEKNYDNLTWASYNETQCANPWQGNSKYDVLYYLKGKGIEIFDINIVTYSTGPFCLACTCSSGRIIYVLINENDAEAIKKLEFNILKP
jgi:hypothetical protein